MASGTEPAEDLSLSVALRAAHLLAAGDAGGTLAAASEACGQSWTAPEESGFAGRAFAEAYAAAMAEPLDAMGPEAVPEHHITSPDDFAKVRSGRGEPGLAFAQWRAAHAPLAPGQPFSRDDHIAFPLANMRAFDSIFAFRFHGARDLADGVSDVDAAPARVRTVSRAQVHRPINASGLGRWRADEAELAPLIAAPDPAAA